MLAGSWRPRKSEIQLWWSLGLGGEQDGTTALQNVPPALGLATSDRGDTAIGDRKVAPELIEG